MPRRNTPRPRPLRRDLGSGIALSLVQAPDHGDLELAVVAGSRIVPVATGEDARRLFETLTAEDAARLLHSYSR
jgi:hypothetical protein